MRLPIIVAVLSVLILSGCSSTVIFESDLEGAEVTTIAGQKYGVTPVSVSFSNDDLDASRGPDGCARILGVTYTWPSGAKVASPNPIVLCGDGYQFRYVMKRPSDAPGLEKDLQNALSSRRDAKPSCKPSWKLNGSTTIASCGAVYVGPDDDASSPASASPSP